MLTLGAETTKGAKPLYIIAYLDKEHYKKYDVDNLPKHFCDALNYFVGDDSKIQTLVVEKKQIKSKKPIKSDYLEQFFVCVADKHYKKDLIGIYNDTY